MKTNTLHSLLVTALLFGSAPAHAASLSMPAGLTGSNPAVITVEADCFAIGQDKAAELGGTLAKAEPDVDGGAPVCKLVIVVPGKDGGRPKRVQVTVPQ